MTISRIPGAHSVSVFDGIFSAAHARCQNLQGAKSEPHFIRQLISQRTIEDLNSACPTLFDITRNEVSFRAAFLHHSPYASFEPSAGIRYRRELADAMFVIHITEPDASGIHHIVHRAALLLMFKTSDAQYPETLAFDPAAGTLPSGSDEEQFYLFNKWPRFELQTGKTKSPNTIGTFDISQPGNSSTAISHDVGKFALVWKSPTGSLAKWSANGKPVHWLSGEPTPSLRLDPRYYSLGKTLDDFIDRTGFVGRSFNPGPPSGQNWDALISTLLGYSLQGPVAQGSSPLHTGGYLNGKSWGKMPRDINPAGLSFMTHDSFLAGMEFIEAAGTAYATLAQHSRETTGRGILWPIYHREWDRFESAMNPLRTHIPDKSCGDENPFPVLIATVSKFQSEERPREAPPLTPADQYHACTSALERLLAFKKSKSG